MRCRTRNSTRLPVRGLSCSNSHCHQTPHIPFVPGSDQAESLIRSSQSIVCFRRAAIFYACTLNRPNGSSAASPSQDSSLADRYPHHPFSQRRPLSSRTSIYVACPNKVSRPIHPRSLCQTRRGRVLGQNRTSLSRHYHPIRLVRGTTSSGQPHSSLGMG